MFSSRTLPVLIGIVFLSSMFLMGQDTWGPVPEPTVMAKGSRGNPG